ncbi:MAG: hypothetical protein AAB632_03380 [Patescibacteria group bacterium]
MKKVVIAGSTSLEKEMRKWVNFWNNQSGCEVIDWPNPIDEDEFMQFYPKIHREFFENITLADIVFIANEDKDGIKGYLGAETFAELAFAVSQNLVYRKNIKVILAKMPSEKVQSIDEINLWLKLGWIKIYNE